MNNKLPLHNDSDIKRIWGETNNVKIFISHRDSDKYIASQMKNDLLKIRISSFVAHEDITPSEEWIKEILIALQTMDILIVYISDEFFSSVWTNQEVGFALGKNIPILIFKDGDNPKGFISIIQAMIYEKEKFLHQFIKLISKTKINNEELKNSITDNIIDIFSKSHSFDNAAYNFKLLQNIDFLNRYQENNIVDAFNTNAEISGSFYINGYTVRGKANNALICDELYRWTKNTYEIINIKHRLLLKIKN